MVGLEHYILGISEDYAIGLFKADSFESLYASKFHALGDLVSSTSPDCLDQKIEESFHMLSPTLTICKNGGYSPLNTGDEAVYLTKNPDAVIIETNALPKKDLWHPSLQAAYCATFNCLIVSLSRDVCAENRTGSLQVEFEREFPGEIDSPTSSE